VSSTNPTSIPPRLAAAGARRAPAPASARQRAAAELPRAAAALSYDLLLARRPAAGADAQPVRLTAEFIQRAGLALAREPSADSIALDAQIRVRDARVQDFRVRDARVRDAGPEVPRPSISAVEVPPDSAAGLESSAALWTEFAETLARQTALVSQCRRAFTTDRLTGLANFGHVTEVLAAELQRSRRTGRVCSLLLLDLDRLKAINDDCGHLVGNRALIRLAAILKSCCRSMDTPARFGGDEFVVVAPESGPVAARQLARRITARCAGDREWPRLSVSIGLATFPAGGASPQALFEAADRAMYRCKQHARPARAIVPRLQLVRSPEKVAVPAAAGRHLSA